MKEKLMQDLMTDLKIPTYPKEPPEQYAGRLVYSGLALWMQVILLNQTIDLMNQASMPRTTHLNHTYDLLIRFLEAIPEAKAWFQINKAHDMYKTAEIMQNRLIYSNNIVCVDHDVLALPNYQVLKSLNGINREIGFLESIDNMKSIGISRVIVDTKLLPNKTYRYSENFYKNYEDVLLLGTGVFGLM